MKLYDKIYAVILFLQFSETYRLLAYFLRLPTVVLSVLTLLLNIIYILIKWNTLKVFFQNKIFNYWFVLFVILPPLYFTIHLLFGYLTLKEYQYWFFFNLLFSSFFVAAGLFAYNVSQRAIINLVIFCVVSTVIGFILNFTSFDLFRQMAILSNNDNAWVVYGGDLSRGISFFEQGNRAAFSIICFFILLFGLKYWKISGYLFMLLLLLTLILITGSRTSLLLTFIVMVSFIYAISVTLKKRFRLNIFSVASIIYFTVIFGFVGAILIVLYASDLFAQLGYANLGYRLNLTNLFSPNNEVQDKSLVLRLNIISVYWHYIQKNLLFGYGPAFVHKKLSSNIFENVSQNQYLENSIYYGILYTIYYVYILVFSYLKSKFFFKGYALNIFKVFVVFIFLLGFSVNNLYWNRSLIITVGLLTGFWILGKKNLINPNKNEKNFKRNLF